MYEVVIRRRTVSIGAAEQGRRTECKETKKIGISNQSYERE